MIKVRTQNIVLFFLFKVYLLVLKNKNCKEQEREVFHLLICYPYGTIAGTEPIQRQDTFNIYQTTKDPFMAVIFFFPVKPKRVFQKVCSLMRGIQTISSLSIAMCKRPGGFRDIPINSEHSVRKGKVQASFQTIVVRRTTIS